MVKIGGFLAGGVARVSAAATVAFLSVSEMAHAATFGDAADKMDTQMGNVGKLVVTGSMVAGLGFVGAGLMKLKAASDSGGRDPYGPGLIRLGVGAGMVGLPMFSSIFRDSLSGSDGGGTVSRGTATFQ